MIPDLINKSKIPHKPGVYTFKDKNNRVLYVGKAIDLYHRVASYFAGSTNSFKTSSMVSLISDVDTTIVESELEALILEANYIKKYLPPYNIRLTDDKDYLYIGITKEDFPKVITTRKKDLKYLKAWFGPFPSSITVKNTLKRLRRVFPWCSKNYESRIKNQDRQRSCFYYHLGLCPGACIGIISQKDYNKIINRFCKFLSGNKAAVLDELISEMDTYSKKQLFEDAAKAKKIIQNISYLTQTNRVAQYLEDKNFLEQENIKAIEELQKVLKLPNLPVRIEAYDISNISGIYASGSMVVLTNGEIDKSEYRRFKIKTSGKPNDYAMHAEMMTRRLKHPEWGIPQLLLIDGGRGQVKAVYNVILNTVKDIYSSASPQNDKLSALSAIPIFGLAKRFEWLYPPEGKILKLPKRSLSLRLLQKIRDESHRFAIAYHKKLRKIASGIKTHKLI